MGYSIQNSETGEFIYIETDAANVTELSYDAETGEPIMGKVKVRYLKQKHFQIPKQLLRGSICEEFEKEILGKNEGIYQEPYGKITKESDITAKAAAEMIVKPKKRLYERDDYINMEGVSNDIILGYNKSNYRILLLPTFFFFNIYAAVIIMLLETFFHFWAHLKNGLNMDKNFYYRSPLHIMTSQFCAKCRSESEMDTSIFLALNRQMRAARKSKTLKDVTKAIS